MVETEGVAAVIQKVVRLFCAGSHVAGPGAPGHDGKAGARSEGKCAFLISSNASNRYSAPLTTGVPSTSTWSSLLDCEKPPHFSPVRGFITQSGPQSMWSVMPVVRSGFITGAAANA